jgi:hypothetical protein
VRQYQAQSPAVIAVTGPPLQTRIRAMILRAVVNLPLPPRRECGKTMNEGGLFYTLLFETGVFGPDAPPTLMAATRRGQLTCAELLCTDPKRGTAAGVTH